MDQGKRVFTIPCNDYQKNWASNGIRCNTKQGSVRDKRKDYPLDSIIQKKFKRDLIHSKAPLSNRNASYWNGFHVFGIMIGCIMFNAIITILPQHNVIKEQHYWFELAICFVLGIWPTAVGNRILDSSLILNCAELKSIKVILDLVLTFLIAQFAIGGLFYYCWTHALALNYPVPFVSHLSGYPVFVILMIRLWTKFPKDLRNDSQTRKKLQIYVIYCLYIDGLHLQLKFLAKFCITIRPNLQWTVAIVVPLLKEGNDWTMDKLVSKAFMGTDINDAKFVAKAKTSCFFSFWLVLTIGTTATEITSNCLLGVNFGMQLLLCLRVIRCHRQARSHVEKSVETCKWLNLRQELLQDILISEILEFMVPLIFMATFSMAYYGPNSTVLGSVGNDYWHFKKVDNLEKLFIPAMEFMALDLLACFITTILFWKFCRINVLQKLCDILKKFWPILTMTISQTLNKVINNSQFFFTLLTNLMLYYPISIINFINAASSLAVFPWANDCQCT